MEIRVPCTCEQTYAFEVEPVNGVMPCAVSCPVCGADGTGLANEVIRQNLAAAPVPPRTVSIVPPAAPSSLAPTPPASPASLRINRQAAPAAPPPPPVPAALSAAPPRFATPSMSRARPADETHSLGLGVLGALIGAGVGAGILFGLSIAIGFKFPLFGTITGALSGFGARTMYKGTDSTLGAVSAVISVVVTSGTMFLLFGGDMGLSSVISIIVSASVAWRIAS